MRNPNKPIKAIDDREKNKEDIARMIDEMMKTDEEGYPEEPDEKETA